MSRMSIARRSPAFGAFVFVALAALLAPPASAQQVQASVTMQAVPAVVQPGQMFRLEVRAEVIGVQNPRIELPDLSAFELRRREISTPHQLGVRFGNQRPIVQSTTVYRLVLRALQPGTFELAPAAVVGPGGERFESAPLTIQVGGAAADPGPAGDPTAPPVGDATEFDPQGFIRTVVDDPRPYVGQQVTVTVYLYAREPVRGSLQITQEPTAAGFWVHDLLPPTRSLDPQRQDVHGIPFNVYVLRRFAAFPLREGPLTIGATAVSTSTGGGLFGLFDRGAPLARAGVPLTLEAQPLPSEGRPPGRVHVGSLELTAELDRAQVATGDAVQLTVTAEGVGQMSQIELPSPSAPGLRVLEPEIDDQVSSPRDLVGGTRIFRWLIVPEREGETTLGPFEVPVFDPATRTYAVARAPALTLTAAGNPTSVAVAPAVGAPSADDEAAISLGPIRTRSALSRSPSRSLAGATWLPYAFAGPPLIFAAALIVRTARRRGDGAARASKSKAREAKRRLATAAKHADASAPAEFYAAIAHALKELLEAKLGRALGSLTHAELRRLLVSRGLDEGLAERVVDELEGCDFARFAAAGARAEEMQLCLTRARAILEELDRFAPRPEDA